MIETSQQQFIATVFGIVDATDVSKVIQFDASAITTSTIRTIFMPDTNINLSNINTNNAHRLGSGSDHSDVATNNSKVTNATHSGDMVGDTALTAEPALISGKSLVSAAGADHALIYDATDGFLKKALVSDFGTSDHSALNNLTWSTAGHTINSAVDFATNNLTNGGTIDGTVVTGTTALVAGSETITTGATLSYKTGVCTPTNTGLWEICSTSADKVPSTVNAALSMTAFHDGAAAGNQYGAFIQYRADGTLSSNKAGVAAGLFGGCLSEIDTNGNAISGGLYGLNFACEHAANFAAVGPPDFLKTTGCFAEGFLGSDGFTITGKAKAVNAGGWFRATMDGTFDSTAPQAGENYGLLAVTQDSGIVQTNGVGSANINSYGVYIDAAASKELAPDTLGGTLNSWSLYVANAVDNFLGPDNTVTKFGSAQDAGIWYDGTDLHIDAALIGSGTVVLDNLPVASAGLATGAVWNNSNVLNII